MRFINGVAAALSLCANPGGRSIGTLVDPNTLTEEQFLKLDWVGKKRAVNAYIRQYGQQVQSSEEQVDVILHLGDAALHNSETAGGGGYESETPWQDFKDWTASMYREELGDIEMFAFIVEPESLDQNTDDNTAE